MTPEEQTTPQHCTYDSQSEIRNRGVRCSSRKLNLNLGDWIKKESSPASRAHRGEKAVVVARRKTWIALLSTIFAGVPCLGNYRTASPRSRILPFTPTIRAQRYAFPSLILDLPQHIFRQVIQDSLIVCFSFTDNSIILTISSDK
jgi:hypothetical protein